MQYLSVRRAKVAKKEKVKKMPKYKYRYYVDVEITANEAVEAITKADNAFILFVSGIINTLTYKELTDLRKAMRLDIFHTSYEENDNVD
jgi:hypothetical protein